MKIGNSRYCLEVIEKGGEIQSFYDKEKKVEFMWQGDADFWSGKNPTLFPLVGNTYHKDYEWKGERYAMKNHGLIRYIECECVDHGEDYITMEFRSNEETLKQYPFAFTYRITYKLTGNRLDIVYHITNDGEEVMPFSFGLHPGFNCPLCEGERFEDYKLVFPVEEKVKRIVINEEKVREEDCEFKELLLNYDWLVDAATIVYRDIRSDHVDLVGPQHRIRVSAFGYPFLAFWTAKKGAPYICIEPWYGHADFEDVQVAFDQREGMMSLQPHKTFVTSYTIEVE